MIIESRGFYKIGGAAFIAGGALFLLQALLSMMAGVPPSNGVELVAWVESNKILLSFINEAFFFATVFLIPAVIALYKSLAHAGRIKVAIGCGIMAMLIPVLMVLLIIHGRLVFPVYGLSANTPDTALLVVALFYGGLHAVSELFGVATFILSLAMRRAAYGRLVVVLGFVTAVADVIGAYPYAIGPTLTLFCQTLFAAWFAAVGWKLIKLA